MHPCKSRSTTRSTGRRETTARTDGRTGRDKAVARLRCHFSRKRDRRRRRLLGRSRSPDFGTRPLNAEDRTSPLENFSWCRLKKVRDRVRSLLGLTRQPRARSQSDRPSLQMSAKCFARRGGPVRVARERPKFAHPAEIDVRVTWPAGRRSRCRDALFLQAPRAGGLGRSARKRLFFASAVRGHAGILRCSSIRVSVSRCLIFSPFFGLFFQIRRQTLSSERARRAGQDEINLCRFEYARSKNAGSVRHKRLKKPTNLSWLHPHPADCTWVNLFAAPLLKSRFLTWSYSIIQFLQNGSGCFDFWIFILLFMRRGNLNFRLCADYLRQSIGTLFATVERQTL